MLGRHGKSQPFELAGTRQEALVRVFGIQAQFDRVAVLRDRLVADQRTRQRVAGRDAQLQFDQIEAEHHLGDRMLDLQARIDLHEIEIAARPDDEFDRAGVDVVERAPGRDRGFAHLRAQLRGDERRGRFLHDFLVAPLRRTFALVEMHDVAVAVAEDLEFDMPRLLDVAFEQYAIASERVLRFALAAFQVRRKFPRVAHDAHALAAAAVCGLDHQRESDAHRFACEQLAAI